MEFYRIDKRLKSMDWSERFLFGMNTVHNLFLLIGLWALFIGIYIETNFSNLMFLFVDGSQNGLSYGVIIMVFSAGLISSSAKFYKGTHVLNVIMSVVTRLVFWGISLMFLVCAFSNLSDIHGLEFIMNYHPELVLGFGSYLLTPYILMALAWETIEIVKIQDAKKAERESNPS